MQFPAILPMKLHKRSSKLKSLGGIWFDPRAEQTPDPWVSNFKSSWLLCQMSIKKQ